MSRPVRTDTEHARRPPPMFRQLRPLLGHARHRLAAVAGLGRFALAPTRHGPFRPDFASDPTTPPSLMKGSTMHIPSPVCRSAAGLLVLLLALPIRAADAPPVRAPGLWSLQGPTGTMAGRMCVGPNEDLARQRRPDGVAAQCDTPRWQTVAAGHWRMEMVCRSGGVVATHRSEVTGNPQQELVMRMSSHYEPARSSGADQSYEMRFTRVGDCPTGVAPGSMVLPNGMVIDPAKAAAARREPR